MPPSLTETIAARTMAQRSRTARGGFPSDSHLSRNSQDSRQGRITTRILTPGHFAGILVQIWTYNMMMLAELRAAE
jgi:hypothetical protein